MEAVRKFGLSLRLVRNQTNGICLEAIRQNGSALEYVYNQTEEICLEAVRQDGLSLRFVRNQKSPFLQNIKTKFANFWPKAENHVDLPHV